jgi:hypothetical protein
MWTASSLPKFICERGDLSMTECEDAMRSRLVSMLAQVQRVFQVVARVLMSSQVIRVPLLLGNAMCVRSAVRQFGGSLVVLEM